MERRIIESLLEGEAPSSPDGSLLKNGVLSTFAVLAFLASVRYFQLAAMYRDGRRKAPIAADGPRDDA